MMEMDIPAKPWKRKELPRRILIIRLQAMGDVIITLPYVQHLRNSLPASVQIDMLTRPETSPVPQHLDLFNKVFLIRGKRSFRKQLFFTLLLIPRLFFRSYDVVIDLQNNRISRLVRKSLKPLAWSAFDRFSPFPAGERTSRTIEAAGLTPNEAATSLDLKKDYGASDILHQHGWNGTDELVVLNPAGVFVTRNWPLENYVAFARLWLNKFPETKFLILGLPFLKDKGRFLETQLAGNVINLVGMTSVLEAFAILQYADLVLSEDSGLMHMAWVSGIPTLALFGGTRSDWSRPLGRHSLLLGSSDLPCGNCMQETCKWGDVRCLTRYSPEMVFEHACGVSRKDAKTQ